MEWKNIQTTVPSYSPFQMSHAKNRSLGLAELCTGQCCRHSSFRCFLSFLALWFTFNFLLPSNASGTSLLSKKNQTRFCQCRFADVSLYRQKPWMVLKVAQHRCNLHNIFILKS